MDHSKKKAPQSFEALSFPLELSDPAQVAQLPEVRRVWDAEEQAWYYSIVDFISILTDAPSAVTYWTTFKKRRKDDPFLQDIFRQLKMQPMRAKDGKLRETECATRPLILRIVQNILGQDIRYTYWQSTMADASLCPVKIRYSIAKAKIGGSNVLSYRQLTSPLAKICRPCSFCGYKATLFIWVYLCGRIFHCSNVSKEV